MFETIRISITLTTAQKTALDAAWQQKGGSLSQFIRDAIAAQMPDGTWPEDPQVGGHRESRSVLFRGTFWLGEMKPDEPAHDVEYRDSAGNTLRILEREEDNVAPEHPDAQQFLYEYGYAGPNDWQLA
jgi:hypothetical protein